MDLQEVNSSNIDTILELIAKIQELQNEVICMNDSRDFEDAESVRSPCQPAFFTPFQNLGGTLSRSLGMPSRNDGPSSIWDTHGKSGNVFFQIQPRLLQHLIRKGPILGSLMYQNIHYHM